MKKLSALFLVIMLMMSVSFLAGCENKAKNDEFETTKYSLEQTQEASLFNPSTIPYLLSQRIKPRRKKYLPPQE